MMAAGRSVRHLICPVCDGGLAQTGNALKCARSHSFDIAREGYVNLLPAGRRSAGSLGDSKPMVLARRRFLERGFYQPLSDAIDELVADRLAQERSGRATAILDAGCGEGYYLGRLRRGLARGQGPHAIAYYGVDVSKEAVRLAAKRDKGALFAVASITGKLPFAERSIGVLLNSFAPRNPAEFARVLAPEGLLLVVIPSPTHLAELRSSLNLLDIEEDKEGRVIDRFAGAFRLVETGTIGYEIGVNGEDLADLVLMTPNARHRSPSDFAALGLIGEARTAVGFRLLLFRRAG